MQTVTKKQELASRRQFMKIVAGASVAAGLPSLLFAEKAKREVPAGHWAERVKKFPP